MSISNIRNVNDQILSKHPVPKFHLTDLIFFCFMLHCYSKFVGEFVWYDWGIFQFFHQIKEKRFFFGKWFTVIFFRRPLGTPFRGLNMFTWRPTLIFLVRAPWGKTACTWGTTVLLTTPPGKQVIILRLSLIDKCIYELYKISTVLCISVRPRPKRPETRVIIKISTHPCYPWTFDYFSWD